ncbi:MAG: carbohydrate ABC transporter permease [Defluviitaleaceae bacterium]|nr:carbohydrate ABC transporter permease [Defluviitaleaceae bacterium]
MTKTRKTLNYILLVIVAFLILIPFFWMLSTALKTENETLHIPPLLLPAVPQFGNFARALTVAPFMRYFANTVIVAALVVSISSVITVLTAFAFARLKFIGSTVLFFVILSSMMVPQELLIITNFMTIANLGWMNTFRALVLPFGVNAFNIFLLRQTMRQIPEELYTATRVDGLSNFQYLRKVVLPITKPTILTTMLLSVIWTWNTFAWPNLITTRDEMRLITNGLSNAFTARAGNIQYELQMAAATLVVIPLILVFIVLRKQIFAGMSRAGIKG